ncbi:Isoamyl alcohol oxidase [Pyrenophora tritici-repentis]|nr:Isoamyl alcohol oxidase [Pyrenophora tritici-repentis]
MSMGAAWRSQILHILLLVYVPLAACQCKCTPSQACWPTADEWSQFNQTISGKLIKTAPVMLPCYVGPSYDAEQCAQLNDTLFYDPKFEAQHPVGYDYPLNETCPPPTVTDAPASECQLGNSPVYAINATMEADIQNGIRFAKEKNLRVVIKSSGHDFVQRSKGFYGLSIWLYHFRGGFTFNEPVSISGGRHAQTWNGTSLTINGAYAWSDIYPNAWEKGVIVVGGNQNGPCSTGGWTQGGGHSPVTRNFGMGGDQVLSAKVILASGELVEASPDINPDLFFAIRGGGPGTYGVVTQLTVKTYPNRNVNLFYIVLGAQGTETVSKFLDAMTGVYSSFPSLSQKGFAGYGYWVANSANGLHEHKFTNVWYQAFTITGKTAEQSQKLFQSFEDKVLSYNSTQLGIQVNITKSSYVDYSKYFANKTGTNAGVGGISALSSRFLDTNALSGDKKRLRAAMDVMGGEPGKPVYHTLVHHGLETTHGLQINDSAVQPGWYRSVVLDIFERDVVHFSYINNIEPFTYIRSKVEPVYRILSPSVGTYMNEADWGNVQWKEDFYGVHFDRLSMVKQKYDPDGVFYCITCVGSENWVVKEDGTLCKSI